MAPITIDTCVAAYPPSFHVENTYQVPKPNIANITIIHTTAYKYIFVLLNNQAVCSVKSFPFGNLLLSTLVSFIDLLNTIKTYTADIANNKTNTGVITLPYHPTVSGVPYAKNKLDDTKTINDIKHTIVVNLFLLDQASPNK